MKPKPRFIFLTVSVLLIIAAACQPTQAEPTPTAIPTLTATHTPAPTATEPQATETEKITPTVEVVAEDVPVAADYGLGEMELQYSETIENGEGGGYALYTNAETGLVMLVKDIKTEVVEHAVYGVGESGIRLLVITDKETFERENAFFSYDEDLTKEQIDGVLSDFIDSGFGLLRWAQKHSGDAADYSSLMPSISELGDFGVNVGLANKWVGKMSNTERGQIVEGIRKWFLSEVKKAKEDGGSFEFYLRDKRRTNFDATKDILVVRFEGIVTARDLYLQSLLDSGGNNGTIASVEGKKVGNIATAIFSFPTYPLFKGHVLPVGGWPSFFLRPFFGGIYFSPVFSSDGDGTDMTGSLAEILCRYGGLGPDDLPKGRPYGVLWDRVTPGPDACAIQFVHSR